MKNSTLHKKKWFCLTIFQAIIVALSSEVAAQDKAEARPKISEGQIVELSKAGTDDKVAAIVLNNGIDFFPEYKIIKRLEEENVGKKTIAVVKKNPQGKSPVRKPRAHLLNSIPSAYVIRIRTIAGSPDRYFYMQEDRKRLVTSTDKPSWGESFVMIDLNGGDLENGDKVILQVVNRQLFWAIDNNSELVLSGVKPSTFTFQRLDNDWASFRVQKKCIIAPPGEFVKLSNDTCSSGTTPLAGATSVLHISYSKEK